MRVQRYRAIFELSIVLIFFSMLILGWSDIIDGAQAKVILMYLTIYMWIACFSFGLFYKKTYFLSLSGITKGWLLYVEQLLYIGLFANSLYILFGK